MRNAGRVLAPAPPLRGRLLHAFPALLLTAVLIYAVLFLTTPIAQTDRAGREDRNLFLLALGVLGVAHSFYSIRRKKPREELSDRALDWLALLLPSYAAFQFLPLPLAAIRVLSPARAQLQDALAPLILRGSFAPLSVTPSLSLVHFLLFAAYVIVFFIVREIARSSVRLIAVEPSMLDLLGSARFDLGCAMDRAPDPLIGPAAADVRDGVVDLGVARFGIALQESRNRHDLAGLAVAALRHVVLEPGALDRMCRIRGQTLDGRDRGTVDAADRHGA